MISPEGAEELVPPVQDIGEERSGPHTTRSFLPGSGPTSHVIWCGVVGDASLNYTSPGELPSQGGDKVGGDEKLETYRKELGLPPARICPAFCGIGGDGDLNLQTLEYVHAVHCNATYS